MRFFLALLLILTGNFLRAQLIIRNTTVIDVEAKKVLPAQDVLVQDGKITAIGKKLTAPSNARVIDGTGKFLAPGWVDAHIHFAQSGGILQGRMPLICANTNHMKMRSNGHTRIWKAFSGDILLQVLLL